MTAELIGSATVFVTDYVLSVLMYITSLLIMHCFFDDEVTVNKKKIIAFSVSALVLESVFRLSGDVMQLLISVVINFLAGICGTLSTKGRRLKRFFAITAAMFASCFSASIFSHMFFYCLGKSLLNSDGFMDHMVENSYNLLVILLSLIVILYLTKQFINKGRTMPLRKIDKAYTIVYLIYMVAACGVFLWLEDEKPAFADEYSGTKLFISLVTMTIALLIPMLIVRNRQTVYFNMLSEQHKNFLEAELAASKQFREAQEETRAFRHDVQNNLSVVSMLMSEGKYEEAEQFINEMHTRVSALSPKIVTGDEMLDSLIASKMGKITEAGIQFRIDGVADGGIGWKAIDICTVFANALDNAIEACLRVDDEAQRFIDLCFRKTEHQRLITLSNSSAEDVDCEKLLHSEIHVTSKEDRQLHGYGVRNMRRTIEQYGGMLRISCMGGQFRLDMILEREPACENKQSS